MPTSPLWSATLNHLCIQTEQPEPMRRFFRKALKMEESKLGSEQWCFCGIERRIILRKGTSKTLDFSGFSLSGNDQLERLRKHILKQKGSIINFSSPLFQQGGFSVQDPDGNMMCFGVERLYDNSPTGISGRLQHVVVTTPNLERLMHYYGQVLGFLASDQVVSNDGDVTAVFYRSDIEHHSFAAFKAAEKSFDHCAYETPSWNHIRDWADYLASLDIPIWWGPGRHGAGNNLFFMILDPDGNKVEFSAEIEHIDENQAVRYWPHDRRTLNLWGNAWMRD